MLATEGLAALPSRWGAKGERCTRLRRASSGPRPGRPTSAAPGSAALD